MSNAFSRKQHIRSAIFTFPKGKNQMPNSIYPQWFHKFITLNHSLHKDLCCKLKPSYWSVLYLVKSSQIPATDCRNLEGILKAPSRIQYPKHSHPRQNSLEISTSVWQMIRMDVKISGISLTEKVIYWDCKKGLKLKVNIYFDYFFLHIVVCDKNHLYSAYNVIILFIGEVV